MFFLSGCSSERSPDPFTQRLFGVLDFEDKDNSGYIEKRFWFFGTEEGYSTHPEQMDKDGLHYADLNKDEKIDPDEALAYLYSDRNIKYQTAYTFALDELKLGNYETVRDRYGLLCERFSNNVGPDGRAPLSAIETDLIRIGIKSKHTEPFDVALMAVEKTGIGITSDDQLKLSKVLGKGVDSHSVKYMANALIALISDTRVPVEPRRSALSLLNFMRNLNVIGKAVQLLIDINMKPINDPQQGQLIADELNAGRLSPEFGMALFNKTTDNARMDPALGLLKIQQTQETMLGRIQSGNLQMNDPRIANEIKEIAAANISWMDKPENESHDDRHAMFNKAIAALKTISPDGGEMKAIEQMVVSREQTAPRENIISALVQLNSGQALKQYVFSIEKDPRKASALLWKIRSGLGDEDADAVFQNNPAIKSQLSDFALEKIFSPHVTRYKDIPGPYDTFFCDDCLSALSKGPERGGVERQRSGSIDVDPPPEGDSRDLLGLLISFNYLYKARTNYSQAHVRFNYGNAVGASHFKKDGSAYLFLSTNKVADKLKVQVWHGDYVARAAVAGAWLVYRR
ncbi:MAG: hypothetical protein WC956_04455 [bacterium]